ncbi:MAG: hypothetical protein ABW278_16440 [Steroidobacteraceae bacterium]
MDGNRVALPARHWRAGQWLADGSLETLKEMNRQCLLAMAEMARLEQQACPTWLHGNAAAWVQVDRAGLERLAASPYLFADAGFDDDMRWRCLDLHMVHDHAAHQPEAAFTGPGAAHFIRGVLQFGWYLARANRQLARVALGMTPVCAERLCQLHLHDMDRLAQCRPGWVRPRWERNPRAWHHLLAAARDPEGEHMARATLLGLQLMAANAIGAASGLSARMRRS